MKPSATATQNIDHPLVQHADIEEMVISLFDSMLDLPIESVQAGPTPNLDFLTASIEINGDCAADFHIAVDEKLAQQIAVAMFGIDDDELSDDETFDALCEAVNVVGGNVKGLFDGECSLSLPRVGNLEWDAAYGKSHVHFESEGSPMVAFLKIKP